MNETEDIFVIEEAAAERILDLHYKLIDAYRAIMDQRRYPAPRTVPHPEEEILLEMELRPRSLPCNGIDTQRGSIEDDIF